MKILLVSSSSGSRGGGEKFLIGLAKALTGQGNEVALWVSSHSRMDELCAEFKPFGPVIRSEYRNTYDYRTRPLGTLFNEGDVRRIAAEWESIGADVIHINKQNLEDGLDLLRAADRCRTPSVCTVHLPQGAVAFGAKLGWFRDWVSRFGLRAYSGIFVAVQESRSEELRGFVDDPRRVATIEYGVDEFDFQQKPKWRAAARRELGWGDDLFVVCCVARMVDQKRPDLFLDVALRYVQENRRVSFLWVGDGALTVRWDARVTAAGAVDRIRRLPWQHDVKPYLAAADLYLHTAAYEGCPFALLEAMAAGLPCAVAADLLATMPVFAPGELLSLDPAKGLAAMDLTSEQLAAAAKLGQSIIEERFSLAAMARRYEAVYRQAALAPRL